MSAAPANGDRTLPAPDGARRQARQGGGVRNLGWLASAARFARDENGSAPVQFIFIIPLYVAVLALVSDFGGALWNQQALQQSLGGAARLLSRAPLNDAGDAIADAYVDRAKSLALTGSIAGATPQYAWWTRSDSISVAISADDPSAETNLDVGFRVVTITASVEIELPFLSIFVGDYSDVTLQAAESARHIGS